MTTNEKLPPDRNPIKQILDSAMQNLRQLAEVDTVIGEPVKLDGSTIIPISKVTIGLIAGGGEYGDNEKKKTAYDDYAFAGGSGSGVSVQPIGFLVNDHKGMRVVRIDNETAYDKLLGLVPDLLSSVFKGDKKKKC